MKTFLDFLCDWYRRSSAAAAVPPGLVFPAVGLRKASDFRHGVEILNDSRTPMTFVLHALQEYAGLSRGDASVAVAVCHSQGGVLIPTETVESAEEIADRISQAAQLQSVPLPCRAVSGTAGKPQSAMSESSGHSGRHDHDAQ